MPHQFETVVAPEHLVADKNRRNTEYASFDRFAGLTLQSIRELLRFGPGQGGLPVEPRGGEELTYDCGFREVAWGCPAGRVDRMVIFSEASLVLGDQGASQSQAGIRGDEVLRVGGDLRIA